MKERYTSEDECHFPNADRILKEQGVRNEILDMRDALTDTPLLDDDMKQELRDRGWKTGVKVWDGRRFTIDGLKNHIALESIGEESRIDSMAALIRVEALFRQESKTAKVLAAALYVPLDRGGRVDRPSGGRRFERTVDLASKLQEVRILTVPLSVFGVDTRKVKKKT